MFKSKCVLLHKDPSDQMTVVEKLLKELKQEVSELKSDLQEAKEEVKILKQEKGDTMKTVKKDVLQVEAKAELKELKTKQSSLAEETNKRLNILASTQDIFNKNQTEELKDLRRMLTEKTLDTNTEPNSTMTEQKMNYLTTQLNSLAERQDQIRSDQIGAHTEMSNFTTQLNNLTERQMTLMRHDADNRKKELGKDVDIIELKRAVKKLDVQQTRTMNTMAEQNELTHSLTRQLGAMHDQMNRQFDAMYDQISNR